MHVLGTGVPRRLGVAGFASSPKAAQALGCSLTPGLRISIGRVTCMARAASVPGLWTLGFLLLCGACVWVWVVFGLGFPLHPATPGWGDGVCVCWRARSACTPPFLDWLCGVGVCAWARVSAAPRHSWLGCWILCVLVCPLRLYPATPGWGVRCGFVCSGSVFGSAPPLLAGVLGCACLCAPPACTPPLLAGVCGVGVCAWARVSAAPRHSWLGCWVLCVLVCPLRLYPATPGWGVPCGFVCSGSVFGSAPPLLAGVLGCACLCAPPACTPPLLAGMCGSGDVCLCSGFGCAPPLLAGLCGVGVCAWPGVSAAPRHSRLGCWGVRVLVCALRLYGATPGWALRCGCVCFRSGFGCAPPLLAGVLGCACLCARSACTPPLLAGVCGVGVCAWARVSAAPCHSWLGCAAWVCVLGLGFRLRPATHGWGVGLCGCLCVHSACTPPLLAGVCGVGTCAWAWFSAAPRYSWLGCWGSVCACVRAPLVPRHSWLGCACGRVCLGSGFGCAAPLLAGVLGCACLCVRSACTPPLLAGVCGVGLCAWVWVSAAHRHSWLQCAAWVCVLGPGFGLRPATPGWGVGVLCVLVCALRVYPATPGWGVRCGRVCLGLRFGCVPPLLAGVLGCACACVCAPLVPRHSWLGCAVWACVLGLGFQLRPATPGSGVGVCVFVCALRLYPATSGWGVLCGRVCLGSGSGCAPPLLAGVCGVGVCALARVSAAPRYSWLGCWGSVCACVRAPLVPRHSWLGCAVWACVLGYLYTYIYIYMYVHIY